MNREELNEFFTSKPPVLDRPPSNNQTAVDFYSQLNQQTQVNGGNDNNKTNNEEILTDEVINEDEESSTLSSPTASPHQLYKVLTEDSTSNNNNNNNKDNNAADTKKNQQFVYHIETSLSSSDNQPIEESHSPNTNNLHSNDNRKLRPSIVRNNSAQLLSLDYLNPNSFGAIDNGVNPLDSSKSKKSVRWSVDLTQTNVIDKYIANSPQNSNNNNKVAQDNIKQIEDTDTIIESSESNNINAKPYELRNPESNSSSNRSSVSEVDSENIGTDTESNFSVRPDLERESSIDNFITDIDDDDDEEEISSEVELEESDNNVEKKKNQRMSSYEAALLSIQAGKFESEDQYRTHSKHNSAIVYRYDLSHQNSIDNVTPKHYQVQEYEPDDDVDTTTEKQSASISARVTSNNNNNNNNNNNENSNDVSLDNIRAMLDNSLKSHTPGENLNISSSSQSNKSDELTLTLAKLALMLASPQQVKSTENSEHKDHHTHQNTSIPSNLPLDTIAEHKEKTQTNIQLQLNNSASESTAFVGTNSLNTSGTVQPPAESTDEIKTQISSLLSNYMKLKAQQPRNHSEKVKREFLLNSNHYNKQNAAVAGSHSSTIPSHSPNKRQNNTCSNINPNQTVLLMSKTDLDELKTEYELKLSDQQLTIKRLQTELHSITNQQNLKNDPSSSVSLLFEEYENIITRYHTQNMKLKAKLIQSDLTHAKHLNDVVNNTVNYNKKFPLNNGNDSIINESNTLAANMHQLSTIRVLESNLKSILSVNTQVSTELQELKRKERRFLNSIYYSQETLNKLSNAFGIIKKQQAELQHLKLAAQVQNEHNLKLTRENLALVQENAIIKQKLKVSASNSLKSQQQHKSNVNSVNHRTTVRRVQ